MLRLTTNNCTLSVDTERLVLSVAEASRSVAEGNNQEPKVKVKIPLVQYPNAFQVKKQ
ncbi:hypothetical protein [Maribacter sp. 4G9]|uniref:hypothetical protein n=1 Tax=Maribacter sp. 4G9 TaxID=1889777 RepID=UPI0013FD56DA|nr:hypothetical protein [Maribacter sp. 4G9]